MMCLRDPMLNTLLFRLMTDPSTPPHTGRHCTHEANIPIHSHGSCSWPGKVSIKSTPLYNLLNCVAWGTGPEQTGTAAEPGPGLNVVSSRKIKESHQLAGLRRGLCFRKCFLETPSEIDSQAPTPIRRRNLDDLSYRTASVRSLHRDGLTNEKAVYGEIMAPGEA